MLAGEVSGPAEQKVVLMGGAVHTMADFMKELAQELALTGIKVVLATFTPAPRARTRTHRQSSPTPPL